jgi:predicted nucleic acid-binding Zn ribbon protein
VRRSWYEGLPPMTHYRRSPRSFGLALEDFRDRVAPETLLAEVQRVWPQAVGAAIAAEALPTAERGGVLTVSCSAAVWAQELNLMSTDILDRLNGFLNGATLARLRCVTGRPR